MKPMIVECGPALVDKDIQRLEAKIGARLPSAYRRFLMACNGGRPEPRTFAGDNVLHYFYGIRPRAHNNDVNKETQAVREWLPAEVITIAKDPFGDQVVLAIKGKNRGKVYFWDHEGGTERVDVRAMFPEIEFKPYVGDEPRPPIKDDWPGHPDLTLIADSFTEFLESFHDEPEDGGEPEPEDEPPEPEEDDDEPEDEPPGPPPEPAVWLLPGKSREVTKSTASKARGGSTASKARGGSKATKAKPRAEKATKARSRDKR